MIVSASFLAANFGRLEEEVKAVVAAGADWIHWDVMDGCFVPNLTFGPVLLESVRAVTSLPFDVHLMVQSPENYVQAFQKAGTDLFTFHIESTWHPHRLLYAVKEAGMKAGIALNPGTSLSMLEPLLPDLDLVLLMSVNPGFARQHFIPSVVAKLETLSSWKREKNYAFLISVDGGVKEKEARICEQKGADVVVSASYIFQGNYRENIARLRGQAGRF